MDYPYPGDSSRLIALVNNDTALVCVFDEVSQVSECRANRGTDSAPIWKMGFDAPIAGGAAAASQLYLTTTHGVL